MNEGLREELKEEKQVIEEKPKTEGEPLQETAANETLLLLQRVTEAETLAAQYKDQLLRKAAEFENYKKRMENDYFERVKYANEELALEVLPIVDDFERSMKSGKEKKDFDTLNKGIELIYQKLVKMLEANGAVPYSSIGHPFDPHLHDALMQMPRNDVPPHTVVEEVEKGYKMHGKVLRHAKVVVSSELEVSEPTVQSPESVSTQNTEAESKA